MLIYCRFSCWTLDLSGKMWRKCSTWSSSSRRCHTRLIFCQAIYQFSSFYFFFFSYLLPLFACYIPTLPSLYLISTSILCLTKYPPFLLFPFFSVLGTHLPYIFSFYITFSFLYSTILFLYLPFSLRPPFSRLPVPLFLFLYFYLLVLLSFF